MRTMLALDTDIQYLKGVGPLLAKKFQKIGARQVRDLLYYFPRRYVDRTKIGRSTDMAQSAGQRILLRGWILAVKVSQPRPHFSVLQADIRDAYGTFRAVWFNQKFLAKILRPEAEILVAGKVVYNTYAHLYQLDVDDYELLTAAYRPAIVPLYDLTEGLTQKKLRQTMRQVLTVLPELSDPLPPELRQKYGLADLALSVRELHFPTAREAWRRARQRLVFDDFFYVELGAALRYQRGRTGLTGISFQPAGKLLDAYYATLPYPLTGAQQRVIAEVLQDMAATRPMNRLVQGDVGSGKTDVAVAALLCAVQSGYQAALMAPTEVLAAQHFAKIAARLEKLGVRVTALWGRHTPSEKKEIYRQLAAGECAIVIGTQAVIQEKVVFLRLGLVIIDEQHRFGVIQRQLLQAKSAANVDLLVLTATPIPRTLALTVYGDLDKSIIDELPPGRAPIKTSHVLPRDRAQAHEFLRRHLRQGEQAYIVYPLVEESEKIDLKAATESYAQLLKIFPEYQLGLLHGRLKNSEKEAIMRRFRSGEINILVSTTVIEVGVDVPNATVMLIENAGRFGLAQLHQLRGRVGRGQKESFCFLITEAKSEDSQKRIKALVSSTDGFKLAEIDLAIRGPGDFTGVAQSGFPDFSLADLVKDEPLLQTARTAAFALVERDLRLTRPEHQALRAELRRRSRGLVDYILLN
ncbi:ATP-dependent DNA helicase RecG [Candidatus Termititenax persephonae]|uniref:ATP-dependent DNA helicase RecG n=1 Tax=Candidatus Termititenax persephonae TaxID=2218525 RepID=A0A388TIM2_9BACT|nr:ATP-dependent DNA helicase RecG [Candidatus Termititenax persephonae]